MRLLPVNETVDQRRHRLGDGRDVLGAARVAVVPSEPILLASDAPAVLLGMGSR